MIRNLIAVAWAIIVFLGSGQISSLQAEVVDKVVAVVGSDIITLSDVNRFKSQKNAGLKKNLSLGSPAAAGVTNTTDALQALIDQKLMEQEIERLQITASADDIGAAIQEILQRNKSTLEQLKSQVASKGLSFERYKQALAEQIQRMKFMGQVIYPRIKINEAEVSKKSVNSTDEARFQAKLKILEERSPEELEKYLAEVRGKTLVEIK